MMRSTAEVCALSGATARQLQVWDELGIVSPRRGKNPRGCPTSRLYSHLDTLKVLVLMGLRCHKVTPKRASTVLKFLESLRFPSGVLVVSASLHHHYVVTKLSDAVLASKSAGGPIFLVDITELKKLLRHEQFVKLQQAREVTGRGN
jgi:hypothetical protein